MSTFNVPTREDVSENNQAIFDNLNKALDFVPNLYATYANSDTALENYLNFANAKTSLSAKEKDTMMKDAKTSVVSLEQTKGAFTQKSITLSEGAYIFEISNNNVGSDVGFVLVPKGKDASKPENHIKTAYVTKVVNKKSLM